MEYTVQEETMQAIADAIRERSETSDPILTSDMPSLILTLKAKWGEITGDIEDQVDLNELFAKVNGYYEDMAVGSAEQLLSNIFETDSTPYLYRTSGGSLEIGDRVYEDAIVGGSVAWNQIIGDPNFSGGWWIDSANATVTYNNNVAEIIVNEGASTNYFLQKSNVSFYKNHKYLISYDAKADSNGSTSTGGIFTYASGYSSVFAFSHALTDGWARYSTVVNSSDNITGYLRLGFKNPDMSGSFKYYLRNAILIDLTQMFSSAAIADHIYTLEQSQAGAGVAVFRNLFPKDYYVYNAGSIKSVQTSAKKVVGFNQLKTQPTNIPSTRPSTINVNDTIASRVFGGVTYCLSFSIAGSGRPVFKCYDLEGNEMLVENMVNIISSSFYYNPVNKYEINGADVTQGTKRYWLQFIKDCYVIMYYRDAAITNACLNIHWDGERDGEYEAYEEHTYPLGNDELRGVYKLSNGKIYADGDIKTSDGQIGRRYTIVNLGSLNWTDQSGSGKYSYYSDVLSDAKAPDRADRIANAICAIYVVTNTSDFVSGKDNMSLGISTSKRVNVINNAYSTASAFKTAMNGVYLVYELETPTTESADPYTNPQLISNWGTEEFIDTRDVPVPVGHDSRYLPDLKAKLESAPNNPSTNGKYFLQYENGQATYVPVPSEVPQTPSEDGTYVLKATVSSGTATLTWVAEE